MLARQPLHPFAVDVDAVFAAGQSGDHPAAVRRVLTASSSRKVAPSAASDLPDDVARRVPEVARAAVVARLAGMGVSMRVARSHPRESSPATSTIVLRPKARSRRLICRRSSSASVRSVLPCAVQRRRQEIARAITAAGCRRCRASTQLGHRLRAAQRREHDLGFLLRRELAVLPSLAQRDAPSC